MLSQIFVYGLLAYICFNALVRPHVGVIGYYGIILLQPEWNWRWSIPQGMGFQKYIAAATIIGFLASNFRGNRFTSTANHAMQALSAFMALAFVSMQFSIAPEASLFYMDTLWKMVLMAFIGIRVIDTPRKVIALLWVLVLAQGFNAYRINESYFEIGVCIFRINGYGPSGDNNMYSILTVPIMAASASLALYSKPLWQKCLAAGILLLQLHQIMLMESRGCMMGGIVMLATLICFMPRTTVNVWGVTLCLLAGAALAGPPVIAEFSSSFKKEGEQRDSSAESRFALWKAGYQITKDHPLLGVGPWAGQYLVPRYLGISGRQKGLHNLYFEIGAGCGIPAAICYFSFFAIAGWACFRLLWRQKPEPIPDWLGCVSLAVFPGLIGYMASSMFSAGALLESSYALAVAGLAGTCIWAAEKRRSYGFSPQLAHFSQETLGIPQVPGKLGRS